MAAVTASDLVALSRLLDEVLALPPGERPGWVDALAPEDRHLQGTLRELLAKHTAPGREIFDTLPRLAPEAATDLPKTGDLVGPYRILREIGHGGMGAVWLAERADGTLKRQVALKLPRLAWGAGTAERMGRERDAGALLEHPNIARLYDAGVDVLGRPFLALEYIDGEPLDVWCESHRLSLRERLQLLLQVARAVAYAHGRLIVHRDLKPSNVLVSSDGSVHLLDFGIAKFLDADLHDARLTQQYGRFLSPRYASPEQLLGEPNTVASDVYSLGVLTYEMLTGNSPYPAGNSLVAIEAEVLRGDPPAASSRARDRPTSKALRGELDSILAKALKRDPRHRYATADAFAEDIDRYLSGERVSAQPDSLGYRWAKTYRRHRLVFAASAAVLATVIVGAAIAVVQAKRASESAERARVVKEFVVDVFKVNERSNAENNAVRQLPAELLLERGARQIETRFARQPTLQAELYGVVSAIFADMSSPKLAEEYARKQLATLDALRAPMHERASALTLLARSLNTQLRATDAERAAREAIDAARGQPLIEADARLVLVDIIRSQSRDDEALAELDRVDAELKAQGQESSLHMASALAKRAFLVAYNGRFEDAVPMYERAIDAASRIEGPHSRLAITCNLQLARLYADRGREPEAKRHLGAAQTAALALGGADEIRTALVEAQLNTRMFMSVEQSVRPVSYTEARQTVERIERRLNDLGPLVPAIARAQIEFNSGLMELSWGNVEAGHTLVTSAASVMRVAWSYDPWAQQMMAAVLGMASMRKGEHIRADELLRQSVIMAKRAKRVNLRFVAVALARNLWMQDRFDEAEADLATTGDAIDADELMLARVELALARGRPAAALALLPAKFTGVDDDVLNDRRLLRGAALCAVGRTDEGLPLMETHVAAAAKQHYAHSPEVARWRALTGLCALRAGDRLHAAQLLQMSQQAFIAQPGVSAYYKAPQVELATKLRTPATR